MDNLLDAVQKRLNVVMGVEPEEKEPETKMFSLRLPLDLLEKIDNIAGILETSRSDVAKMILSHGADAIIEKFQIKIERSGWTFAQQYEFENASPEEQEALIEKWTKEAKTEASK